MDLHQTRRWLQRGHCIELYWYRSTQLVKQSWLRATHSRASFLPSRHEIEIQLHHPSLRVTSMIDTYLVLIWWNRFVVGRLFQVCWFVCLFVLESATTGLKVLIRSWLALFWTEGRTMILWSTEYGAVMYVLQMYSWSVPVVLHSITRYFFVFWYFRVFWKSPTVFSSLYVWWMVGVDLCTTVRTRR